MSRPKLTPDIVRELRTHYRPGVPGRGFGALARRYGVTKSAVAQAVHRYTWKDVA